MERLNLHWLGLPIVELKGRPVKLETHKSTALLAYLSTGGERRQRELVATMLWPEGNQQRALASLRRTLSSLNSRLPGWMEADRETINLKQGNRLWTDVAAWQGLLGRVREHCQAGNETCDACRSVLEEALHFYRGDFLEGLILGDAPVFDDWQYLQRETLRGELAQVLERLAKAYAKMSHWDQAIDAGRRWLALDRLNEPAIRMLMDLLARSGQKAAALQQYSDFEHLLLEQTQQQPELETRKAYDQLRERDHASRGMAPNELPTAVPLLRTKLYIPSAPASLVRRPRLMQQLAEGQNKELTLISAPAGFGKTTLLAEWIAETSLPVAWLSVDAGDNDPYRFLTYLIAALQSIHDDIGVQAQQIMQSPPLPQPGIILTSLLNDLEKLSKPCVLVFDDFQCISERAVNELMAYLLDHPAPNLHLIIATRADPALQLGKLRGYERMEELRTQDLRFSLDEATAFLNDAMRLGLSESDIQALDTRTEGWVVGLQMAALSLKGHQNATEFIRAFSGSHRYVLDYLLEEVLKRQPAHIQRFLLETSILEKLSGPLCDALMAEEWRQSGQSGQDVLEYLESSNLFVFPLDENKQWYRYHHLFADLLRSRMMQSSRQQAALLHRRASHWYESEELHLDAIEHALAAKDEQYAIDLIEKHAGDLIFAGHYVTVLGWIQKLAPLQGRSNPWLFIWHGWGILASGRTDGVDACITDAEQARRALVPGQPESGTHTIRELASEILALRVSLASLQDDHPRTIELALEALGHIPANSARHRINALFPLGNAYYATGALPKAVEAYQDVWALSGNAPLMLRHILATHKLANISQVLGDPGRSYNLYMDLMRTVEDLGMQESFGMGYIYLGTGGIQYEWNRVDEASKTIERGARLCESTGVPMIIADGYNSRVRLLLAAGDLTASDAILRKTGALIAVNPVLPDTRETFEANRVKFWLARGDLSSAEAWSRDRQKAGPAAMAFERELGDLALARVFIGRGALTPAAEVLDGLAASAEAGGRYGRLVEILLLRAHVHELSRELDPALRALERSLRLGARGKLTRTFLDEGGWLEPLLRSVTEKTEAQEQSFRTYVDGILQASLRANSSELLRLSK